MNKMNVKVVSWNFYIHMYLYWIHSIIFYYIYKFDQIIKMYLCT